MHEKAHQLNKIPIAPTLVIITRIAMELVCQNLVLSFSLPFHFCLCSG